MFKITTYKDPKAVPNIKSNGKVVRIVISREGWFEVTLDFDTETSMKCTGQSSTVGKVWEESDISDMAMHIREYYEWAKTYSGDPRTTCHDAVMKLRWTDYIVIGELLSHANFNPITHIRKFNLELRGAIERGLLRCYETEEDKEFNHKQVYALGFERFKASSKKWDEILKSRGEI